MSECDTCKGSGRLSSHEHCPHCHGTGQGRPAPSGDAPRESALRQAARMIAEEMNALRVENAELQRKVEECEGKPYSSNPAELSHEAQINMWRTGCEELRMKLAAVEAQVAQLLEVMRSVCDRIQGGGGCFTMPGMGSGLSPEWKGCRPFRSNDTEEWCLRCELESALALASAPSNALREWTEQVLAEIIMAFNDPGAFVQRGNPFREPMYSWQRRAMESAAKRQLEGRAG